MGDRNPRAAIVETVDLGHRPTLEVARPYLGDLAGAYSNWTPLQGRGVLFPEDVDPTDP